MWRTRFGRKVEEKKLELKQQTGNAIVTGTKTIFSQAIPLLKRIVGGKKKGK